AVANLDAVVVQIEALSLQKFDDSRHQIIAAQLTFKLITPANLLGFWGLFGFLGFLYLGLNGSLFDGRSGDGWRWGYGCGGRRIGLGGWLVTLNGFVARGGILLRLILGNNVESGLLDTTCLEARGGFQCFFDFP